MKSFYLVAIIFCVALFHLQAADKTWTGGGTDNNWSTGANWGGTAPVNNDNLIFSGSTRQNNTNDIGSLTVGYVTFNNGGCTLNGNLLTLNPSTAGIFTNLAGINIIAVDLNITPANKIWNIAAGSELRLAGAVANAAGANPLIILNGSGTLRVTSPNFLTTRLITGNSGTVIVDGGLVDASNDGFRFVPGASQTVACQTTNNGVMRIGGGGNFRMGFTGAASGSTNLAYIDSGGIEQYPTSAGAGNFNIGEVAGATSTFTQSGGLVWGNPVNLPADANSCRLVFGLSSATASGTYNLNGGTLAVRQVVQVTGGATAVFNFNGGTLMPVQSSTTFFQGVQTANVQNGGAVIDTTNFNITIGQSLLANGTGGLTKLGTGTLTLSGTNTYTGGTVVSNGGLVISGQLNGNGLVNVVGGILGGTGSIAGPVTVQPAATLSPGASVGTLTLQSNLTLAGSVLLEADKSLAATNDFVQVSGALTNVSGITVTITNLGPIFAAGDSFKFFSKPLSNGAAVLFSPSTPGTGLAWTNKLAVDGSVGIVTVPVQATPADLMGLTLSIGTLSPAFSSDVLSYTASAAYSNSTVVLTPTSANPSAAIRVICNGVTNLVASGAASSPVALKAGINVIDVRVTAPDNSITKDYVVTFTRIPPNVVVILADDQGFSDWSCYGSEIPTPNLDKLAAGGLRFRQFYNCARCSPTRCAILTGLYTAQSAVDNSQALPNLRNDNNVTIAELLGTNGYRTYMAGKWHLGNNPYLPEQRGFQQVWRFTSGTDHSEDTWDTNRYKLVSSSGEITNRTYATGQFYQSDAIGDYSLDFINNDLVTHADGKPFFLYMAFGSAHFPIQAPKPWVDTNTPVYAQGWDFLRNQRYTNMLAKGIIDSHYGLSGNDGVPPWSPTPAQIIPTWDSLASNRQADLARRMAIYASMVQKMDDNIGRVVELLRQQGQLDNTLIFALSDNGGNYEGGVYGQTGGTNNPTPLTGTALDNMGLSGQPIIYLGGGWAHLSNTPFRLFKHFNHGGGIRTPLVVHWPQGLTRTNQWDDQVGHVMDIMATIVDVTGVSYPTQFNSHGVLPLEGQSLKPLFTGTNDVSRNIGFEHEINRAWISGSWKFVTKNFDLVTGTSPANELELYDLSKDGSEMTNLATAQPVILNQLMTNYNAWVTRVGLPANRLVTIVSVPTAVPATNASDLFVDTFNRPNNTDTDASSVGMWGSRVPPLGATAAYYEGFEGSGSASSIQILSSNLQMAVGSGMSENGIMHNFIGQDILDAGGFNVELNIQEINDSGSDTTNKYVGFGVGLTQAQAASGADIGSSGSFRGEVGNPGVSAFFVDLNENGNIEVWTNGILLNTIPVGANSGVLTASFACTGFTTNDPVVANIFFNGQLLNINPNGTNPTGITFYWQTNNSNYIGLSARASTYARMDNLAIRKLPLSGDLAINYAMQYGLSGTNSAPDADPDGDGVSNFGEWVFGGDPTAPDPFIASLKGALITPTHDFQFDFQRLSDAASYGVQYRYFTSTNLTTWTETTPVQVSVATNEDKPGYEIATMQLPAASIAGQSELFLRVLAEPAN